MSIVDNGACRRSTLPPQAVGALLGHSSQVQLSEQARPRGLAKYARALVLLAGRGRAAGFEVGMWRHEDSRAAQGPSFNFAQRLLLCGTVLSKCALFDTTSTGLRSARGTVRIVSEGLTKVMLVRPRFVQVEVMARVLLGMSRGRRGLLLVVEDAGTPSIWPLHMCNARQLLQA